MSPPNQNFVKVSDPIRVWLEGILSEYTFDQQSMDYLREVLDGSKQLDTQMYQNLRAMCHRPIGLPQYGIIQPFKDLADELSFLDSFITYV